MDDGILELDVSQFASRVGRWKGFKMISSFVVHEADSMRNLAMVSATRAIDYSRFGGSDVGIVSNESTIDRNQF